MISSRKKSQKRKVAMQNELLKDERFSNTDTKTFDSELAASIMISESGYIAILDHSLNTTRIINIKDLNGIELQINNNEDKTDSIKLLLKINDFANPILEVPFLSYEIDIDSSIFDSIKGEVNELMGTLEYLKNKYIENNETQHCG
ncbi:MAG: hypothetical protein FWH19_02475 [Treponema sp.]|nr:hypothetical protein [Treponema sp.]